MTSKMAKCDVHLLEEIEMLKQALAENQCQLTTMETQYLKESDRLVELEDSIIAWQDKYDRLYESHKRVQKVNQNLEDKLLKLVDRNSNERAQLTSDVATVSVRLAQANYNIANLQREIERYKTDMSLAIKLLQCKPEGFVSQKLSTLPKEIQSSVAAYVRLDTNSDSEGSTGFQNINAVNASYRVLPVSDSPPPVCPFPPTAMVYSMRGLDGNLNGPPEDTISPAIVAKYLEDELKRSESLNLKNDFIEVRHCNSCQCKSKGVSLLTDEITGNLISIHQKSYSIGTQTTLNGETNNSLCLRCNNNLNSPSHSNSPYIMKLTKSSGSLTPDSKSGVSLMSIRNHATSPTSPEKQSSSTGSDKKKDDLQVNPILGHRFCDRNSIAKEKMEEKGPEEKFEVEETAKAPSESSSRSHPVPPFDGNKIFENFNRNLINTIKHQDSSKPLSGPRLCSMRIQQNGTTNILLDNSDHNVNETISILNQSKLGNGSSPIVYTRRSRFLDEELDDVKDVIVTTNSNLYKKSSIDSNLKEDESESNELLIELNNKTDSEKYRETVSNVSMHTAKGNLLDLEDEKSETQVNVTGKTMPRKSQGDNLMMLLRQQQLDRVAEWVQKNNEQTSSTISESNGTLLDSDEINSKSSNAQEMQPDNVFGQNNLPENEPVSDNNNEIAQQTAYITNQILLASTSNSSFNHNNNAEKIGIGKDVYINMDSSNDDFGLSHDGRDVDLAQMEYNVKQFLLKQNEWSIKNSSILGDPTNGHLNSSSANSLKSYPSTFTTHRTEV